MPMPLHNLDSLSFEAIVQAALESEGTDHEESHQVDDEMQLIFRSYLHAVSTEPSEHRETQVLLYSSWLSHQKVFDDFRFCNHRFVEVDTLCCDHCSRGLALFRWSKQIP
jgi:hypothetical protein